VSSVPSTLSPWSKRLALLVCLWAGSAAVAAEPKAVTIDDLVNNPKLNAKKFASYFADFAYEFNTPIQSAPSFLAREKGDCDDYAVLADYVLKKRSLDTRLIHIRLAGRVAHAVCYVTDNKAYLDYNNRAVFFTLTRSGADLRDIATKVAESLESSWTTASEFSYSYTTRRKTMITTVSQTGTVDPTTPPSPGKPSTFNVD
jgi:hypothetical protein